MVDVRKITKDLAIEAAHKMMAAVMTAPKAKGVDDVECILVEGDELETLAAEMVRLANGNPNASFVRDAGNIRLSECVVLIGGKRKPLGLNCGHCGFTKCGERPNLTPCTFNAVDLGIAIGSACSVAADSRVDTRVMFTAGLAGMSLGWMPECAPIFALPISISSKSPYFDRK